MGKQKIEMKKLENEDARHVCFSKRKAGIFSKASELATLCGAEITIVMDSPAGSPYPFGSPTINLVVDRFLSGGLALPTMGTQEACRLSLVQELNHQCMRISNQLDAAKKRRTMLEDRLKALVESNQQVRKVENFEELNPVEFKEMEQFLYGLKEIIHFNIWKNLSGGPSTSNSGKM